MSNEVPAHVRTAFGTGSDEEVVETQRLGPAWDNGIKVGQLVYARAGDHAHWSATVRERLHVDGARVARPVRSSDGRFLVAGWKATVWAPGVLSRRVDETAVTALRLEEALVEETAPPAGDDRDDVFARAERTAWAEADERFGPIEGPRTQTGHADLLASTVYEGAAVPTITDLVPFTEQRPRGYSAALVLVDGLVYSAVDVGVVERFAHVPQLLELMVRAAMYRRHVCELHPAATSITRSSVAEVEELLLSRASATI